MATSPITIRPNINVDAKGQVKTLPSERTIVSSGFDWICSILEVIAARLHHEIGGTTASTTTVGLITDICCLFLTSQQNKKFEGITAETIHGWIDELSKVDYAGFLTTLNLGHVYDFEPKQVQAFQAKKDANSKLMVQTINFVYYNLYPSFVRLAEIKKQHPEAFPYLKTLIRSVHVITNDWLAPRGTTTTGLHGEGRFVRFCYIKYVSDLTLLDLTTVTRPAKVKIPMPKKVFSLGGPMQPLNLKSDDEDAMEEDPDDPPIKPIFSDEDTAMAERYNACMLKLKKDGHVDAMKIYVASSQGTCLDCQKMLADLGIAHNTHRYSKESASSNWVDPFTWKDIKSSSTPPAYLSALTMGQQFGQSQAADMMDKDD